MIRMELLNMPSQKPSASLSFRSSFEQAQATLESGTEHGNHTKRIAAIHDRIHCTCMETESNALGYP